MKKQWTEEQARKLLEALQGHHFEALVTLALTTGIRRDELLLLHWQDIDVEKQEVYIHQAKTKTDRRISLSRRVLEVLQQHRQRQMEVQKEAGVAWQNHDLVFPDRTGGSLDAHHFLQVFHEIATQADLPHLRFHDLRAHVWRAHIAQLCTGQEGQNDV